MQLTPSSVSCFVLLYLTSFWDSFFAVAAVAEFMQLGSDHGHGRWMRIWIRTGYEGLRLAACIGDKMQQEEEERGARLGLSLGLLHM